MRACVRVCVVVCGGVWRRVVGCSGVWRCVVVCGGVWRCVVVCGGVWRRLEIGRWWYIQVERVCVGVRESSFRAWPLVVYPGRGVSGGRGGSSPMHLPGRLHEA